MFWWFACNGSIPKEPVPEDSGSHISEPEFVFSIAILADPHISGSAEHSARLNQAIEWINEHHESRQIELVPVLGDVGWETGLSEHYAIWKSRKDRNGTNQEETTCTCPAGQRFSMVARHRS